MRRLLATLGCTLVLSVAGSAADQYANLKFTVVRQQGGKPVANASVILHSLNDDGKQARNTGLQLKTDSDGMAQFRGAPYGKLRVQVLARGFQTFGGDYDIDQPSEEFKIEMQRPKEQFSIYDRPNDQQNDKQNETKPDENKSQNQPQN
ncbi:MAG: carboxypeptidase-like regulatory domain-containing protein [Candidatus Korobacteraceae bacterium]